MKNQFLNHRSGLDILYPIISKLPNYQKEFISKRISAYMLKRVKEQPIPDRITIFLTDQCNLKCPHCFISNEDHPRQWEAGAEEYEKFFKSSSGNFGQVVFTGGEPTIKKDFYEVVKISEECGDVKSILICTNGALPKKLSEEIQKIINTTKLHLRIQLSIDGPEDIHDENRGANGSYNKVIKSLSLLKTLQQSNKKRIGQISVNTTITKQNIKSLNELIDVVIKHDYIHTFSFVRSPQRHVKNVDEDLLVSDNNPVNFDNFLTVQEMEDSISLLDDKLWSKNRNELTYAIQRVTLNSVKNIVKYDKPLFQCYSGNSEFIIFPNGDVAKCEMLNPFDNLSKYNWNLQDLLNSDIKVNHFSKTSKCWCTHECSVGLSIQYQENMLNALFSYK